jgi:DNA-binding GntR family transcriptional regulator
VRALYEKTVAFVLQYIDEQRLGEGAQLPTEAKLAAMSGVSLVTVRRALLELSNQGVVRREQGRGTFVARARVSAETTRLGGLRQGLTLDARSSLETRLLGASARSACPEEALRLGLAAGAEVWEISRLRLLNGQPLILEQSMIPKILAADLGTRLLAHAERSLYGLLESAYGLRELREEQTLLARPAHPRERELLALLDFEWVVEVAGLSYAARQQRIDSFRMVFVAKSFAFRLATAPAFAVEAVELAALS